MTKKYLETILVVDGEVYHLAFHQWRLDSVLEFINTPESHKLSQYLKPPSKGIYRCRVLYDSDFIHNIEYLTYTKRQVKRLKLCYSDTIEYSKKYEDRRVLEALFSKREACDDILIVKNGLITDTTIANVAFSDGEVWFTPKVPLLKGTTRERLLREKKLVEKDISVKEIKNYTKMALMNAMIDFDIIALDNIEDIIC